MHRHTQTHAHIKSRNIKNDKDCILYRKIKKKRNCTYITKNDCKKKKKNNKNNREKYINKKGGKS